MFDAACEREESFKMIGNVTLDLLRRHARVKRGDNDYGDVHRWEHIDRHLDNADPTKNGDNQANYDDEIRCFDSESRHDLPYDFGVESEARLISLGSTMLPAFSPPRDPTTTLSPSFKSPDRISMRCAFSIPRRTGTICIIPDESTANTRAESPEPSIASIGTVSTFLRCSVVRSTSAYIPGISTSVRLVTSTSVFMVRVDWSTLSSKRATTPGNVRFIADTRTSTCWPR